MHCTFVYANFSPKMNEYDMSTKLANESKSYLELVVVNFIPLITISFMSFVFKNVLVGISEFMHVLTNSILPLLMPS